MNERVKLTPQERVNGFMLALWQRWCDGSVPDGFDLEDMFAEHRLTREEPYSPEHHGEHPDLEEGDTTHVLFPEISALLQEQEKSHA